MTATNGLQSEIFVIVSTFYGSPQKPEILFTQRCVLKVKYAKANQVHIFHSVFDTLFRHIRIGGNELSKR